MLALMIWFVAGRYFFFILFSLSSLEKYSLVIILLIYDFLS
jgi:hypothetical protein